MCLVIENVNACVWLRDVVLGGMMMKSRVGEVWKGGGFLKYLCGGSVRRSCIGDYVNFAAVLYGAFCIIYIINWSVYLYARSMLQMSY